MSNLRKLAALLVVQEGIEKVYFVDGPTGADLSITRTEPVQSFVFSEVKGGKIRVLGDGSQGETITNEAGVRKLLGIAPEKPAAADKAATSSKPKPATNKKKEPATEPAAAPTE